LHICRQSLGELPIVDDEIRKASGEEVLEDQSVTAAAGSVVHKLVTADGTYATQSAFSTADKTKKQAEKPPLRKYLMEGDFFIGAALGSTMTKLALRFSSVVHDEKKQNRCRLFNTAFSRV
jgi:coatomer subunit beta